jgi:hypothetical protein
MVAMVYISNLLRQGVWCNGLLGTAVGQSETRCLWMCQGNIPANLAIASVRCRVLNESSKEFTHYF